MSLDNNIVTAGSLVMTLLVEGVYRSLISTIVVTKSICFDTRKIVKLFNVYYKNKTVAAVVAAGDSVRAAWPLTLHSRGALVNGC